MKRLRIRLNEARAGARILGAHFYEPFCDDMGIFYTPENLAKTAAIIRKANPQILLTHSPQDYMEDHQNACRLAVSAAFIKFSPNFRCDPPTDPQIGDIAVYHAQPHGNKTQTLDPIDPHFVVDCSDVIEQKRKSLEQHKSQQNWLDTTQKMSSYVQSMIDNSHSVGRMRSANFKHAEGWRRHLHYGFCPAEFDPMLEALGQISFARITEQSISGRCCELWTILGIGYFVAGAAVNCRTLVLQNSHLHFSAVRSSV